LNLLFLLPEKFMKNLKTLAWIGLCSGFLTSITAWGQNVSGNEAVLAIPPLVVKETGNRLDYLTPFILRAIENNPQLLQSESEARVAGIAVQEARAGLIPRVSLSMNAGKDRQDLSQAGQKNTFNQQLSQIRLIWPLYDLSLIAQHRQRQAASVTSDWRLTDVREQLALRTVEAYIDLVRHTRLTKLAHENLNAHRQYVSQVKAIARLDIGKASELPAAIGRVALATSAMTSRLVRLETARAQWKQLTGVEAPIELVNLKTVLGPTSLEQAIEASFFSNPVIMLARSEIDVARQGVGLAKSPYSPKLNAEVNYRTGKDYGGIIGSRNDTYSGVNLEWALFSGGANTFAAQAANEKIRIAEHSLDRVKQELRTRIETTWHELVGAEASLLAFKDYVDNSLLTLEAYRSQFKLGRRSLLEVLNAENELFTARTNLESTQHDIAQSTWRLQSLRGLLMSEVGL
jgi:outer membrane protein, adhesin transport system